MDTSRRYRAASREPMPVGAAQAAALPAARARIEQAFRSGKVRLRVWLDDTGAVRRLQLVSRTGNAVLDDIIRDDLVATVVAGARSDKATPGRRSAAEQRQAASAPSKLNHE